MFRRLVHWYRCLTKHPLAWSYTGEIVDWGQAGYTLVSTWGPTQEAAVKELQAVHLYEGEEMLHIMCHRGVDNRGFTGYDEYWEVNGVEYYAYDYRGEYDETGIYHA